MILSDLTPEQITERIVARNNPRVLFDSRIGTVTNLVNTAEPEADPIYRVTIQWAENEYSDTLLADDATIYHMELIE